MRDKNTIVNDGDFIFQPGNLQFFRWREVVGFYVLPESVERVKEFSNRRNRISVHGPAIIQQIDQHKCDRKEKQKLNQPHECKKIIRRVVKHRLPTFGQLKNLPGIFREEIRNLFLISEEFPVKTLLASV